MRAHNLFLMPFWHFIFNGLLFGTLTSKWTRCGGMRLSGALFLILIVQLITCQEFANGSFTKEHLAHLKNRTRTLFDHGWNAYMEHGYPADELRPLSCTPYERVPDVFDTHRNDVLGNYSVTFLDSITTFAVFGDVQRFERYIEMLRTMTFNIDSTVQVFETSIRALGSLLSAHLYAEDKLKLPNYDGFLLRLAHDLGERLLRAYTETELGIPVARVNLKHGIKNIPAELVRETCTAGAGSPVLEFTLLSVLTNDTIFDVASKSTFLALWQGRSALDLIPMSLDPLKGKWLSSITGVGASIDSFYEYALKGAILFDDNELMTVWNKAYHGLSCHSRTSWFMANVDPDSGRIASEWVDSLSAFFPGLLVLAGRVHDAMALYQPFLKLWNKYGGIPERWNFLEVDTNGQIILATDEVISLEWYPLRPEFVESTYYLYRSTMDPVFLQIGERVLQDYANNFKAPCGFAGYRDIRTGELQDRMESFVFSETFMYLYLLFDEDNELHNDEKVIFSTEGHPMWVPKDVLLQYKAFKSNELTEFGFNIEKSTTYNASEMSWDEKLFGFIKGLFDDDDDDDDAVKHSNLLPSIDEDSVGVNILDVTECARIQPSGFYSQFLSDEFSFTIDSKFKSQFTQTHSMEVSADFYSIFAPPNAICAREPETSDAGIIINFGKLSDVKECHLLYTDPDLIVMNLKGVMLKLELLKLGQVDSTNTLIDVRYLNQLQMDVSHAYANDGMCSLDDKLSNSSVFRIHRVNGVSLRSKGVLKVLFAEKGIAYSSGSAVKIANNCHLVVNGIPIVNLVLETVV